MPVRNTIQLYLRKALSITIAALALLAIFIFTLGARAHASSIPANNFHYSYANGDYSRDAANPAASRQSSVGYSANAHLNRDAASVGASMDTDAVWSMYAHANWDRMAAYDGSSTSNLTKNMVKGYNLSQLKVAVFYGCDTANGSVVGSDHITQAAVTAGAGASLGFYDKVFIGGGLTSGPAYTWSKYFWESMASGNTINTAAAFARDRFYQERGDYSGVDKWSRWGNGGQKITPAGYR